MNSTEKIKSRKNANVEQRRQAQKQHSKIEVKNRLGQVKQGIGDVSGKHQVKQSCWRSCKM